MCAFIPAAAEYAEIEDPALPDESSTISLIPKDLRHEIKTDVPRSLKEPVGFCASFLVIRLISSKSPMLVRLIIGVFPSPRENRSADISTGSGGIGTPMSVTLR